MHHKPVLPLGQLIQKYASNSLEYRRGAAVEECFSSTITCKARILNFITIEEQAKSLSGIFKERHSHIPFRKIIGLRNIPAHSYQGLEPSMLFRSNQNDIAFLLNQISEIIKTGDFDRPF